MLDQIKKIIPLSTSPKDTVTLIPLAMVKPNKAKIYSPHPFENEITISYNQFVSSYADTGQPIKVSFEPDLSQAQTITAYGVGFDYWYIVK